MSNNTTHCLEVWGDFACFTRPEMKVERYSYPIITPSAARGIFDAIYFKNEYCFYWQIERIEMLNPPKYIALRRNEVKDKVSISDINKWITGTKKIEPLIADGMGLGKKGRTQRQTMALKNVRYRIFAHMVSRDEKMDMRPLNKQFSRRASQGKCFYQPFLGCSEFPAYFKLIQDDSKIEPVNLDIDFGVMVYDIFDLSVKNTNISKTSISVFNAKLVSGVLNIPNYNSCDVLKMNNFEGIN